MAPRLCVSRVPGVKRHLRQTRRRGPSTSGRGKIFPMIGKNFRAFPRDWKTGGEAKGRLGERISCFFTKNHAGGIHFIGNKRAESTTALMQRAKTTTSVLNTWSMATHLRPPSFAKEAQTNPATNTIGKIKSNRGPMTQLAINSCASGRSRPLTSSEDNTMCQTKWQDGRTRTMTIKRSASDTHGETGIGPLVRFLGFAVSMESLWFSKCFCCKGTSSRKRGGRQRETRLRRE